MCGISGSSNLDKAFDLYKKNLSRGCYSSGFAGLILNSGEKSVNFVVHRQKGELSKEDILTCIEELPKINFYAFHSRAPTNSIEEKWNPRTTHPFLQDGYLVAHNGIISNFKNLPEHKNFQVDSEIIPHYMCKEENIKAAYSKLEGLLTSWLYHFGELFLIKAGSSLWIKEDCFSSVEFEGATQIETDGNIFQYTSNNTFEVVDQFNYTNPYFV
jgi:glucosamine 6-phosphate synthetase-like amidotransferase/phosphosugar isomerase protein